MNKHLEKIIELFQAADNLAIFIYNKNGQLIKQTGFKKLSEEIKNKIFEHLNEKVFLASSKEGNLIAAFKKRPRKTSNINDFKIHKYRIKNG
ncbi:hypothetical protein Q757_00690 [Oenococcus alcoholitolerans]|uniref:Uncharacterized protein n=1 Tax=Oenococcus alcoholitolerans TaxID=931074 RepID=A0ABR4XSU0_9LACO|nr:hypothetical protein Q757_00690 [Oenococcus alcoholitolerans]